MLLKVSCRIAINAGQKPGDLVAVASLFDAAGHLLQESDPVALADGVTLEAGPMTIEVDTPFVFAKKGDDTPPSPPPSPPTPTQAKPATPQTGRR